MCIEIIAQGHTAELELKPDNVLSTSHRLSCIPALLSLTEMKLAICTCFEMAFLIYS